MLATTTLKNTIKNKNSYYSILAIREQFLKPIFIAIGMEKTENLKDTLKENVEESLKEFLLRHGVNKDTPSEAIDRLKSEYKKIYHKRKHVEWRGKNKRVEIFFDKEKEYPFLEERAKKHGMKLAAFIKKCIFGYLKKQYVIPQNEQVEKCIAEIAGVHTAIDRIGTNINQIAHHANGEILKGKFLTSDYERQVYEHIFALDRLNIFFKLEDMVEQAFREPSDVVGYVKKQLDEDAALLPQLERLLKQYKAKQNRTDK